MDVTEWRLSNGARVLVKPTDFKADEVLMTAYSEGGSSLVPDREHMSAEQAAQIVSLSGIGAFSRVDLAKKLSGKAASVSASIGETSEGVSGRASPKDLETAFQLVHLGDPKTSAGIPGGAFLRGALFGRQDRIEQDPKKAEKLSKKAS